MQAVLWLLADLVAAVHLPSAVLMPLLRAALISLSVETGLRVLQVCRWAD